MEQNVDVFISHHTSSCLPVTQAICNSLESSGIRCWYAPRDTDGAYAGSIVSAINRCSVFVLVLNHQSSVSQDVLNEINLAVERIRKGEPLAILPFQISADLIGNDAKYYIGRIHWIDAVTPPLEERIRELNLRVTAELQKRRQFTPSGGPVTGTPTRQPVQLKSSPLLPNGNFIGRTQELAQLRDGMQQFNKMFIQGMGGIGKSELAKAYAIANRALYHTVIFATYRNSLCDLLINDPGFRKENLPRACDHNGLLESDDAYFSRKLRWLREHTDEKTLIIIDNFDTEADEHLEAFLSGPYSVIFTTRNDYGELGLPILLLGEFATEEEQLALFSHYYRRPVTPQQRQSFCRILETVNGHTLAIELIAKFMLHRRIQPDQMLAMLRNQGIGAMAVGTLSHGFARAQSGYANIQQLFNLYGLTETERYVLQNMTLVPLTGLDFVTFADLCELEDFGVLDEMIRKSWVRHNISEDTVSLHPLIRDVVRRECPPSLAGCEAWVRNLTAKLKQLWGLPLEDKLLFGGLGITMYEQLPEFGPEHAETYMFIGTGLTLLEQFERSGEVIEKCLGCYQQAYGPHSPETAEAYYRLANNELHRNNYIPAAELLNKAISILEIAAPNSERLAFMIKFLCWTRLGWFDDHLETEQLLHRSHAILAAQDPVNPSQMASQYAAYAHVYYLLGQYEKALDYAEESYRIFNGLHGEIHGDTLAPMGIQARILSKLDQAEESVRLCRRVIDIQIRLNGEDHQKVLNRYEALAEIYTNIGDLPQAREMLKQILVVLDRKRDSTSPFFRRIKGTLDGLNQP